MALANNDIHITAIQRTVVKNERNENTPGYEVHFTIRGRGDFVSYLPIKDFTAMKAMEAIAAVASPIVDLLDTYPG